MRKPNKKGFIPTEDVCLFHCSPLLCRHGCEEAKEHKCSDELPFGEKETREWKLKDLPTRD